MKGISIGWIPSLTTWAELNANVLFWCMKREIEMEGEKYTKKENIGKNEQETADWLASGENNSAVRIVVAADAGSCVCA